MEWLDDQWNEPDRHDFYLMQLAAEVRRPNVRNPSAVQIKNMRIKFEQPNTRLKSPEQKKLANKLIKGKWLAAVGYRE